MLESASLRIELADYHEPVSLIEYEEHRPSRWHTKRKDLKSGSTLETISKPDVKVWRGLERLRETLES